MNDYVDKLWNSDAVACLDALKEADDAVETINKDMFSIIADVAANVVWDVCQLENRDDSHAATQVKDTLKKFEQKYKKERSLKHMPGSYRSAKSTIVNAVKHGINLYHDIDDQLKGKSFLEKEINQATKKQSKEQPDLGDYKPLFDRNIKEAEELLSGLAPAPLSTDMNPAEIKRYLDAIEKYVEGIRSTYGV